MQTPPDLSIVMISRNEAENIGRGIESVLRAVERCPQTEIVLVDSASTDETVEIARQYPISIVRLRPSWLLSAAAGRYIGTLYTRGDLILYLDGDMELVLEWLDQAIPFLLEHPELAGVAGYRRDVHLRDGQIIGEQDQYCDSEGRPVEVQDFGGAALYRRSALEQVGGFNPYIISEEEPELCMRLRHAGYKLICLPHLMNRHYCIPPKSLAGHLRRARLNLFLGFGQIPRYHLGTRLFWTYLLERGWYVVYLIGILVSVVTLLLTLFARNITFFGTWILTVGAFFLVFLIKKRSLRKTFVSFLAQTLIAYGAVRGFLMTPRSSEEYPTDAEIVQVHYQRRSLA
jgi:glycosyltransferase involved in cell wall biosynthesis